MQFRYCGANNYGYKCIAEMSACHLVTSLNVLLQSTNLRNNIVGANYDESKTKQSTIEIKITFYDFKILW